ncbi:hypothetical protein L0657_23495 [Dyadobacter sp. CY345]|uniref:hypothetical protein n=1 Tax=Dyadobacter sp. CY345 TaxID=2909335 RepID=UPI001F1C23DA|nr:hypothetical protein [Dyadobacter sp. CY345]MCF2446939.1 hypothetical protein [Dyadobacter sp. CY345]
MKGLWIEQKGRIRKKVKVKRKGQGLLKDGGSVHMAVTAMNEFNPLAIGINSIKAYFTGCNVNGEVMSSAEATFNLATIFPIGKIGKIRRSIKGISQGMTPNAGGKIVSFAVKDLETYYRLFSGNPNGEHS